MKKKKPPQAPPKEGMSLTLLTCFQLFQTICYKDIPSFGGAWGGFLLWRGLYPACGPVWSSLPSPFGSGAGVRLSLFFHSSQ